MKIDRVILSSNDHPNYIEFWPIVAKAWARMGVKPTLLYTGKNINSVDQTVGDVLQVPVLSNIDSAFAAQNARLLCPALFLDDICIISDIDNMPLSRRYYFEPIQDLSDDKFAIYRPDACPPDQISIMWNAASGKTWSEIFQIGSVRDVATTLSSWYPSDYKAYLGTGNADSTWFTDQVLLRTYVERFKTKSPDRVIELDENQTGFYRLDRLCDDPKHSTLFKEGVEYSDFHMPRPYSDNKDFIDKVYNEIGMPVLPRG